MTTSFESASSCPKCSNAGKEISAQKSSRGSTVYVFACVTEVCRWYNTTWIVQINSDGSIPERRPGDREFPKRPEMNEQRGRDIINQLRQLDQQSKQGRNR